MGRPDRAQRPGGMLRPGGRRGAPAVLAGALGLAVAMAGVAPRDARANGAFPDSQSVLTPSARPNEISLVTNFGVVASHDGGHTWLWSCEQDTNALGYLYQYNAAPQNRLFAVANQNLVFSDDATCGWSIAQGHDRRARRHRLLPRPERRQSRAGAGLRLRVVDVRGAAIDRRRHHLHVEALHQRRQGDHDRHRDRALGSEDDLRDADRGRRPMRRCSDARPTAAPPGSSRI